ncbi:MULTISPECIES: FtsW/RodA/SpoVE family cell cycle protein [Rhodococcus]|uniref:FtsW/RodA/SpoVE family cell cycle protein n=1 Tax=Rhodococcus aetherivorans TaxID=191292 RepID=A0AA46PUD6_9NOCA|nr:MULTISPECIES: FtsW/RodA/SpoVE family cell cycle protein [Rhodococcus]MBC2591798.1 FtsW/RodA/SpoVE family cell cycle protein [Rhodococcus aetherivorans]PND51179.1 hypothetical protein CQZ88_15845 [Rhodococcus sp. ENV425]QIX48966.1 FtsW/RodA/SpoVE family cell cycle protein [Rhodococcus sp. DMU1]QRI75984.1 FtsW/RodA/SpoVE family cell cycle protein [Rhodococcus aetherivorans]QSE59395.1 FtsW/RodA/SpoVE family cell cycle protein [Rhodococcus sp. PSBB066]
MGCRPGPSDPKWSSRPQAYNEFPFSITGEEFGMLVVIGQFAAQLWVGLRVAMGSADPFLCMLAAVATMWIMFQTFVDISCTVTAVLPRYSETVRRGGTWH